MIRRAVRCALGLWSREAGSAVKANFLFAACAGAALWVSAFLGTALGTAAFLPALSTLFLLLIRALRSLDRGEVAGIPGPREWSAALLDSLPSALLAALALALAKAAFEGARFGPVLSGLALWSGLGSLISFGLAAPEGQARWAAAWAGLLAAVAFFPAVLFAAFLAAWLSGAAVIWFGLGGRFAVVLWVPLILAPLFTPGFYAAYLYYLAQGIKDRSQGRPPLADAPTIREILKPWR